jgi:hypothetical protein
MPLKREFSYFQGLCYYQTDIWKRVQSWKNHVQPGTTILLNFHLPFLDLTYATGVSLTYYIALVLCGMC